MRLTQLFPTLELMKTRRRRDIRVNTRFGQVTTLMAQLLNNSLILPIYLKGEAGPPGPQGQKGATGQSGSRGSRGKSGPMGPKGSKGDQGTVGPAGNKGRKESRGGSGIKGQKGEPGDKGESVAVPKITTPPKNQTVLQGDTATFTCGAIGIPKPEIALEPWNRKMNERYKQLGRGMLKIENVKYNDSGMISCVAKSALGKDVKLANLNVLGKTTYYNIKANAS